MGRKPLSPLSSSFRDRAGHIPLGFCCLALSDRVVLLLPVPRPRAELLRLFLIGVGAERGHFRSARWLWRSCQNGELIASPIVSFFSFPFDSSFCEIESNIVALESSSLSNTLSFVISGRGR